MYYLDMNKFDRLRLVKGQPLRVLGIDPNILVRARKGRPIQAATMSKLASALDCDVTELLKEVND